MRITLDRTWRANRRLSSEWSFLSGNDQIMWRFVPRASGQPWTALCRWRLHTCSGKNERRSPFHCSPATWQTQVPTCDETWVNRGQREELQTAGSSPVAFFLPPGEHRQNEGGGRCDNEVPPVVHVISRDRQQSSTNTPVQADENAHCGSMLDVHPFDTCDGKPPINQSWETSELLGSSCRLTVNVHAGVQSIQGNSSSA